MLEVVQHIEEHNLLDVLKEGRASLIGYTLDQLNEIIKILESIDKKDVYKAYWKV